MADDCNFQSIDTYNQFWKWQVLCKYLKITWNYLLLFPLDETELKESYIQEKTHQKLLTEIEMLEDVQLAPVKTMEPMSPTDLAKTEMSRNATFERLSSFDKTTLKNTLTEEKVVLPDVNAISMVRI